MFEIEIHGLAGIAMQMLHPRTPCFPCHDEQCGQKQAPREKPDKMREPVNQERHLVVVVREPPAEETQKVFVDEIEVPEAVNVSGRGVIADGMALVGVRQSAQDVPRSGDRQKEQHAGDWLQFAPAAPMPAEHSRGIAAAAKKTGAIKPLVSVASARAAHMP